MKKIAFAVLFYFTLSLQAFADTSLWKVEMNGSVAYLAGTCHVLRKSDYPLPAEFEKVYRDAEMIVFEACLDKMKDPKTVQVMIQNGLYSDGSTLEKHLSGKAYKALKEYCEGVGIPVTSISRMKPWMAVLTLLSLELKKIGVSESGVDEHFYKKAVAEGKKIEALESVEKQVEFISLMGKGYEDDFVLYSVRDLKQTRAIVSEIISIWKNGDERKLERLFSEQMKKECPELYELILVERNHNWLPAIEGFLDTPEKELVLVGVAHLVGEDGLIALLRKRGYRIEKVRKHDRDLFEEMKYLDRLNLSVNAESSREESGDEVVVRPRSEYKETDYVIENGPCAIRWTVYHTEVNKGVVRARSTCLLSLEAQRPLFEKIVSKIFEDDGQARAFHTLSWGRLEPDGANGVQEMSFRLALAAFESKMWDKRHGRPETGHVNDFVVALANQADIYPELKKLFRTFNRTIRFSSAEKVLIMEAGKTAAFRALKKHGIQAADRLPFDCLTWFAVSAAQSCVGVRGTRQGNPWADKNYGADQMSFPRSSLNTSPGPSGLFSASGK